MTNRESESFPPAQGGRSPVANLANGLVIGIARHWLALVNLAVGIYIGLPFLAPVLVQAGLERPANGIYTVYSFACHQLPDHSYFLFGDEPFYGVRGLESRGMAEGLTLFQRRSFVGSESTGYKVAICQRDVAIYGSVFLGGLLFSLVRRRLVPPSLKIYLLFLIPIALDGLTQLIGLRESTWFLRSVTGALFGLSSVWLAYPYIEDAMADTLRLESTAQTEGQSSRSLQGEIG